MFEDDETADTAETPPDPAAELLAAISDAERVAAAMQAAQLSAIAELDALWAGGPLADFVADEVGLALRISPAAAQDRLHLARTLTGRLPDTLAALGRGDIDLYKARAIAEACARLDDDAVVAAVQARVLPRAGQQSGAQLKQALRRAVAALDPHGEQRRHESAVKDRRVRLSPVEDGMAELWARLPADHAVALYTMLDGLARAAAAEPGETRTLEQLRADTLGEIALGVLDGNGWAGRTLAPRRRARPHLHVTVGADTLLGGSDEPGWLAGYGPIPASMARRIAHDATWRRLLTDPVTGKLLDYGTDTYPPGAVLDAHVTTRDHTCRFPTCTRPATGCDLDHTVPHPAGPTSHDNLAALCRHHHRAKHAGYHLEQTRPGHFTWTTPTGATGVPPTFRTADPLGSIPEREGLRARKVSEIHT
jgi:hypothetical protein